MICSRQNWFTPLAVALGAMALSAGPASAQQIAPIVQETVPYRPVPPGGASYTMMLPPLQADGQRTTLNSNLDDSTALWHFRSAWNVAALNCLGIDQTAILQGYSSFLKKYSRALAAANAAIDQRFIRQSGSQARGIRAREAYMTQLYNYFALPPANEAFCNAALGIASEYLAAPPASASELAAAGLPRFEAVFQDFFRQYQEYQVASAAWDERWGAMYGSSQPGYVAVHGLLGGSYSVDLNAPADTGAVTAPVANDAAAAPILRGERG